MKTKYSRSCNLCHHKAISIHCFYQKDIKKKNKRIGDSGSDDGRDDGRDYDEIKAISSSIFVKSILMASEKCLYCGNNFMKRF